MFSVFTKLGSFFSQQSDSNSRDAPSNGRNTYGADVEAPASTRLRQTPRASYDDLETHGIDQGSRQQYVVELKQEPLQPPLDKVHPAPSGMQPCQPAVSTVQPMQALPAAASHRPPPAASRHGIIAGQRAGQWQRPAAYGARRRNLVPTTVGTAARTGPQQYPTHAQQEASSGKDHAGPAVRQLGAVPPPPAAGVFMHATPSKPLPLAPATAAVKPTQSKALRVPGLPSYLPQQDGGSLGAASDNDGAATPMSVAPAAALPLQTLHSAAAPGTAVCNHPLIPIPSPRGVLVRTPGLSSGAAWQPSADSQVLGIPAGEVALSTGSPAMPVHGNPPQQQPPLNRQLFLSPRLAYAVPKQHAPIGTLAVPAAGPAAAPLLCAAALVATRRTGNESGSVNQDWQPQFCADNFQTPAKPRCRGWNPKVQWLRFSELDIQDEIGEGASGKVHIGQLRCGGRVAVKVMNIKGGALTLEFQREVDILSSTPRHQNILRLLAACYEASRVALVTEYCSNGALYNLLHSPDTPPMKWEQLLKLWLGIARGMAHLHGCNPPVLHRDLKSANVLLDSGMTPKICDFGLSRAADSRQSMTVGLGTYQWMAPEVMGEQQYSLKADVYSFAIIMWECLARALPYQGKTTMQAGVEVMYKGLRPPIPPGTPEDIVRLMQHAWAQQGDQRPTFAEVTARLEGMLHNWPAAQLAGTPPAWQSPSVHDTTRMDAYSTSISASSSMPLTTGPSVASPLGKQSASCVPGQGSSLQHSHLAHGSSPHAHASRHHTQGSGHHTQGSHDTQGCHHTHGSHDPALCGEGLQRMTSGVGSGKGSFGGASECFLQMSTNSLAWTASQRLSAPGDAPAAAASWASSSNGGASSFGGSATMGISAGGAGPTQVACSSWYGSLSVTAVGISAAGDVHEVHAPAVVPIGASSVQMTREKVDDSSTIAMSKADRAWTDRQRGIWVNSSEGGVPMTSLATLTVAADGAVAASVDAAGFKHRESGSCCNGPYTGGGLRNGVWRRRPARQSLDS